MAKPKIYISSTFFDLVDHRDYLITRLGKTESFDIVSMENYGTRDTPPLEKCLKDVESSEFYILLIGHRYGFIPPEQKASITHLEFLKATEGRKPGVPNKRCVLPFIIDVNYVYKEEVIKAMEQEAKKDDVELTEQKKAALAAWRESIQTDFMLDDPFTTPSDLASKVLGALVPVLIDRKYTDAVSSLLLPPELAYRCDRNSVRNEFLHQNYLSKNFYKAFIIHGEVQEMPKIFSNNITNYELTVGKNSITLNMDDYTSNTASNPDGFVVKFILDSYKSIFNKFPDVVTLDALASSVINDPGCTNVALMYEMDHESWKEKYKKLLPYFFDRIAETNLKFSTSKNFYLLINIKYSTAKEKLKKVHPSSIVLERLSKLRKSHIEQWVRTYFLNTRKEDSLNYADDLAQAISDRYFPGEQNDFTMKETVDRLKNIISDFNNNENLFKNPTKPTQ